MRDSVDGVMMANKPIHSWRKEKGGIALKFYLDKA